MNRCRLAPILLVGAVFAAACGGDPAEDGNVHFKQKDWYGNEDAANRFQPVPLVCEPECPGGEPCIETPDGVACATPCDVAECPDGFHCLLLPDGPFCVRRDARLCMPCQGDDDCQVPNLGPEFRCVPHGDGAGSFCTVTCSDAFPCAAGYLCEDRGQGTECFPADGTCECTPLAATLGAKTECSVSGDKGSCPGIFECSLDGGGFCDAPEPAQEICNGKDDDCDGKVDEDFLDLNGNGVADCYERIRSQDVVSPDEDVVSPGEDVVLPPGDSDGDGDPNNTDCAPLDPTVYTGALEICNGKDDNCNGEIDEGQGDADKDGVPDCADPDDDNDGTPDDQDCDPFDPIIHPGAGEVCNGKDDNCDGQTDTEGAAGCVTYNKDADGDGYGTSDKKCLCVPGDGYAAQQAGDCDDGDGNVHPGATEKCNGKDDDCNGSTDPENTPGCIPFRKDADKDGYGTNEQKCLCGPSGDFTAENGGDCNDGDKAVHPGAQEVCNGKDDNCDGSIDPPGLCQTTYKICIDPGDGGSSPGAVAIVTEKNINLAMGLKARDWLKADTANSSGGGTWQVLMTRDTDKTVSVEARADYANSNGANRFVSIHNNACGYCGGTGTETYHKSSANAETKDLANKVQARIVGALGLKDRGVKTAEWYVLTHTNMPATTTFPGFCDTVMTGVGFAVGDKVDFF